MKKCKSTVMCDYRENYSLCTYNNDCENQNNNKEMYDKLNKLIDNIIVLANNNAAVPILENFILDVKAGNCGGDIDDLNEYIEEELQEWAYN